MDISKSIFDNIKKLQEEIEFMRLQRRIDAVRLYFLKAELGVLSFNAITADPLERFDIENELIKTRTGIADLQEKMISTKNVRVDIVGDGGHEYLGFAKNKLSQMKRRMYIGGTPISNKRYVIGDTDIYIQSVRGYDWIRIEKEIPILSLFLIHNNRKDAVFMDIGVDEDENLTLTPKVYTFSEDEMEVRFDSTLLTVQSYPNLSKHNLETIIPLYDTDTYVGNIKYYGMRQGYTKSGHGFYAIPGNIYYYTPQYFDVQSEYIKGTFRYLPYTPYPNTELKSAGRRWATTVTKTVDEKTFEVLDKNSIGLYQDKFNYDWFLRYETRIEIKNDPLGIAIPTYSVSSGRVIDYEQEVDYTTDPATGNTVSTTTWTPVFDTDEDTLTGRLEILATADYGSVHTLYTEPTSSNISAGGKVASTSGFSKGWFIDYTGFTWRSITTEATTEYNALTSTGNVDFTTSLYFKNILVRDFINNSSYQNESVYRAFYELSVTYGDEKAPSPLPSESRIDYEGFVDLPGGGKGIPLDFSSTLSGDIFICAEDYDYDTKKDTFIMIYKYQNYNLSRSGQSVYDSDVILSDNITFSTTDKHEIAYCINGGTVSYITIPYNFTFANGIYSGSSINYISCHLNQYFMLYTYVIVDLWNGYQEFSKGNERIIGLINIGYEGLPIGYHREFTITEDNYQDFINKENFDFKDFAAIGLHKGGRE